MTGSWAGRATAATMTVGAGPFANLDSKWGAIINAPLLSGTGSGTTTDANGNQITTNGSSFTDTLNTTALTVSAPVPPASATYTYTGPNGSGHFTVQYTPFNIKTVFGCSGVGEYNALNVPLVTEIDLPDNTTKYTFAYEGTPGYSGYYTGRIASITLPTGGTISYAYTGGSGGHVRCADGSAATLTRTVNDNNGNLSQWTYAHTESGTAWTTTITDPNSKVTTIHFQGIYETSRTLPDSLGSSITCYNGNTTNCDTTAIGLPITQRTVTPTLGGYTSRTTALYNGYGLPTETDEYAYGVAPNPGSLVRKSTISYSSCGVTNPKVVDRPCTVQVKDAGGTLRAETDNVYDANGNLLTETHLTGGSPTSISRLFTYTSNGVLATSKDFNGNTLTYSNTSCANAFPTTVTPPLIPAATLTWDCNGGVQTKVTDANNQPTNLYYTDPNNYWRPTEVDYPDGGKTTTTYTDAPNAFSIATSVLLGSPGSHEATQALDGLGRVIESTDNSTGAKVDTTYDVSGRVHSVSNPYISTDDPTYGLATYAYDGLGRVTNITRPDGSTFQASYNSEECVIATDEAGKSRKTCTDALGRVNAVFEDTWGLAYETVYTYDVLNNLIGVTQGSEARTYNYDMLSRLTSATTPESGTTNFYYATSGGAKCSGDPNAVCRRTDARGITTTYTYDALNRLTQKSYSDGTPTAYYGYDQSSVWGHTTVNAKGHLTWEQTSANCNQSPKNCSSEIFYNFDAVGRTLETAQCTPSICGITAYGLNYGYDQAGDLTDYYVAWARQINFSYDSASRLSSVTSSLSDSNHPGTLLSGTSYGPAGLTADTLGNNVHQSFGYNDRTWLSSISSTPHTLGLTYAGNGNVLTANDSVNGNWTYGYDGLNRLSTAGKTGQAFSYVYDRYGNRTQENPGSQFSFDAHNHITYPSGYVYDTAGNLTSDGNCSYTWDGEERMATATCPGSGTTTYIYDAEGRRVAKASGSTITEEYLYNLAGQRVSTYGPYPGMTWMRDEIWAGSRHLATYANGTTYFNHADGLGTERARTAVNGSIYQTCTSLPFGDGQSCVGTDPTPYHFTGLPRDTETGNDSALFRYFDYAQGRWLSPDPLGGDITNPQSLNRYAYVMNNPTTLTDPLGLCARTGEPGPCGQNGLRPIDIGGFAEECLKSGLMAGPQGCIGQGGELAADEVQYDARVAAAFLKARGYTYGTDKNGTVYLWMPGSQVCSSNDGSSVGCGQAVKGQWTKLSDLDYASQSILGQEMVGFMSGSMTDSRTYIGWTAAAASPTVLPIAINASTVLAANNPATTAWLMRFAQAALAGAGAAPTNWASVAGKASKFIWNWWASH